LIDSAESLTSIESSLGSVETDVSYQEESSSEEEAIVYDDVEETEDNADHCLLQANEFQ